MDFIPDWQNTHAFSHFSCKSLFSSSTFGFLEDDDDDTITE